MLINHDGYFLYNNQLDNRLYISRDLANVLNYLFDEEGNLKYLYKFFHKTRQIINTLDRYGFLTENENIDDYKIHIFNYDNKLPLTSFNIELTDICNLKCRHCYGSFGLCKEENNKINYDSLRSIIDELFKLNCFNITLTGGECTIHPEFELIMTYLLKCGFNVGVMTNGLEYKKLIKYLDTIKNYKFTVKVSLDGLEDTHNIIRGDYNSYSNAINLIDNIYERENVRLYISTTLMKSNFSEINQLASFIHNRYPNCIYSTDIVMPSGQANQNNETFSVEDLLEIKKIYPDFFTNTQTSENTKHYRCSGGINQATLLPDGRLKICNCACDERFYFDGNVFDMGLEYLWKNPGENIIKYRNEKSKDRSECLNCNKREFCRTDCRVTSFLYTGNENLCSPITYIGAVGNNENSL